MAHYGEINDIKKHLNIDYDLDDALLGEYIDSAKEYIETYTARAIDSEELSPSGKLRPSVRQALRLLVGHYYANREAITYGAASSLPLGVDALLLPLKKFGRG